MNNINNSNNTINNINSINTINYNCGIYNSNIINSSSTNIIKKTFNKNMRSLNNINKYLNSSALNNKKIIFKKKRTKEEENDIIKNIKSSANLIYLIGFTLH